MSEQIIDIEALVQDDHNFNRCTEDGQRLMEQSFKEHGAGRSILLDKDGRIIAGNKSQRAAIAAGIKKVRVIETTGDELVAVKRTDVALDSAEGREMAFLDNLTTQVNLSWDEVELEGVSTEYEDFAPEEFGFEMPDPTDGKGESEQPAAEEDEFDEEKDAIEARTMTGDMWKLGNHYLLCGDSTSDECVQRLLHGERAQMCFTDPPYGYEYKSNHKRNGGENYDVIMNDDKILDFFPNVVKNCDGFIYVCTSWKVLDTWMPLFRKYLKLTNMVVWDKGGSGMGDLQKTFATDYEIILVSNQNNPLQGSRCGSVWKFNTDVASSYLHPTQKPVALPAFAIEKTSKQGDIVLDLFGGSGSTLIACEQLNRKARLMELDPHYCDVIIARWEKLTGLKAEKIG